MSGVFRSFFFCFLCNLYANNDIKGIKQNINNLNIKVMLTIAIIIYIILAVFFGPLWPLSMFGRGGCLGQLIVAAWVALLISGLNN